MGAWGGSPSDQKFRQRGELSIYFYKDNKEYMDYIDFFVFPRCSHFHSTMPTNAATVSISKTGSRPCPFLTPNHPPGGILPDAGIPPVPPVQNYYDAKPAQGGLGGLGGRSGVIRRLCAPHRPWAPLLLDRPVLRPAPTGVSGRLQSMCAPTCSTAQR